MFRKRILKRALWVGIFTLLTMACSDANTETKTETKTETNTLKWPLQAPPLNTELRYPSGDTGFYTPRISDSAKAFNFNADLGGIGNGLLDESLALQSALDGLSANGGGRLFIPKGIYIFSEIDVPSNTHMQIEAGTIIRPIKEKFKSKKNQTPKKITIFSLGKESSKVEKVMKVENASIVGVGGAFTVELHEYQPGITVVRFGNVENFRVSNMIVRDNLTKFSALTFGASGFTGKPHGLPTNGYISNIKQFGAHYGYGVVQTQAAQNVYFENLSGEGGAVLRLETGYTLMNDKQYGGVANLIAKNISCKDGNAAVMISPHSMHNGAVVVDKVHSDGCGFAVRVANGFISKKNKNPNIEIGTFAAGTAVSNISATFGRNAQLKKKHFRYMPERLLTSISKESEDGESNRGPSISPVLNIAKYPVEITNITSLGFEGVPDIITKRAQRSKR